MADSSEKAFEDLAGVLRSRAVELTDLIGQVADLTARLGDLETHVDGLRPTLTSERPLRRPTSRHPNLVDLEKWVQDWVCRTIERPVGTSMRWCSQWYNHPEAMTRFWVLFNSHQETVRYADATGMARWYIDVADPHLEVLLAPTGPFSRCSPYRHVPSRELPFRSFFQQQSDFPLHDITGYQ